MKYVFLSVNEDLNCGLLKSQFIKPIKNNFSYDYEVLSINRPFYKQKTNNVTALNVLIPQGVIAYNSLCFIYHIWAAVCAILLNFKLKSFVNKKIIARGYLSGLVAYYAKKIFKVDYIFDPRSLYPLECITANRMEKDSIPYKFWFNIERRIVSSADRTVCVSVGMADYYSNSFGVKNTIVVPCYRSDQGGFRRNKDVNSLKIKLGLNSANKTVLYFGSLNSGWNNLELYLKQISTKFSSDVQFLVVSQDKENIMTSKLGCLENVHVYSQDSLPDQITIDDVFHCSDYGMIFMAESHDWFTRLSVKFAEYTYFGLPVITNQWVGEAVRLINDNNLYPSKVVEDEKIELEFPTLESRVEISQWADNYFSPDNINKYVGG
ncbi:hypothetical protein GNP82_11200 [Aliivibrio fischeri]|uniref:hypothetical protein n=1 Tax=Aliivibrio fischeri TaxID=668 RepID=UPI0012D9DB39|nr:hypothetical protein [Aliivibrio fischeri]MUK38118.1 hypothetical protein [Aliivibrio fischeri]MUL04029.1 hypothetical protein [Aliivibrio fischeri]